MKLSTHSLLFLSVIFLQSSCAGLIPRYETPTVQYDNVQLESASFGVGGIEVVATTAIYNPNSIALPLKDVKWSLAIGHAKALSGTLDFSQEIPAKARVPIQVTIKIPLVSAAKAAAELSSGNNGYILRADFRFNTPIGDLTASTNHRGTL